MQRYTGHRANTENQKEVQPRQTMYDRSTESSIKGLNSAFQQVDLNRGDDIMGFSSEVEISSPNFVSTAMLSQDTSEF